MASSPASSRRNQPFTRPVTRLMRAEIELENHKGYLQPGMYGTASVLIEDRSNVLTVPATALIRRGEGSVEVYVVADTTSGSGQRGDEREGVLRRVPVVLGIDDGKEVEIRSGLKGNELIVARGNGTMRPTTASSPSANATPWATNKADFDSPSRSHDGARAATFSSIICRSSDRWHLLSSVQADEHINVIVAPLAAISASTAISSSWLFISSR